MKNTVWILCQMTEGWKLYYVSWPGYLFSILVREIHQQLTLKMWENFTDLFAYKFDYTTVILLTLFPLPAWLCVQLLYMSEDGKSCNIFHVHFSLCPFEKLISVSRAPQRQVNLTFKSSCMNVTTLLRRQFVFRKLCVLHGNFSLYHTPCLATDESLS
jgi:hypothetical protein